MYSIYAYLMNCTVCLVMAAVLFFRDVRLLSPVGRAFRLVRRLMGVWLLVEAAMDILAITLDFRDAMNAGALLGGSVLWVRTAIYVALCLGVIYVQGRYIAHDSDLSDRRQERDAHTAGSADAAPKSSADAPDGSPQPLGGAATIDEIVAEWVGRADKPFLRESITVTQVAGEMHISARLLSQYVNNVKHVNFNTWINQLKTAEVKRIIDSRADCSFVQIAAMTGFADAPAMSKTFKAIVGMSPSAYRNRRQNLPPAGA